MRCQFCGTENEEGTLFCRECGKRMKEEKQIQIVYCPRCGKQNDSAAVFCKECGMKLRTEVSGEADVQKSGDSEKMKILIAAAVIVLAVLGGGGLYMLGNKAGQSRSVLKEEEQKKKEIQEERQASKEQDAQEQASKGQDTQEEQASREEDAEDQTSKEQDTQEDHTSEDQDAEKPAPERGKTEEQTAKEESEPVQEVRVQTPAITMQNINTVAASSELAEANTVHFAARIMDGDKNTAWVEGAAGQGEGQFIQFSFNDTYLVSGIRIRAGYQKNDDIYYKNSRPRKIRLEFSNGTSTAFELADRSREEQVLTFIEPIETRSVNLVIESVYPGVKYEDTCISEVILF